MNNDKLSHAEFLKRCTDLFDLSGTPREKFEREVDSVYRRLNGNGHVTWLAETTRAKRRALIIVDVQNDFIDGTLSVRGFPARPNLEAMIESINDRLLSNNAPMFDLVVYTLDWHPKDHISFYENYKLRRRVDDKAEPKLLDEVIFELESGTRRRQTLWPAHCVQGTFGAELHKNLRFLDHNKAELVYKGDHSDVDAYSAFFDNAKEHETRLHELLQSNGIVQVFVCGIAFDFCVGETAIDAAQFHGYHTALIEDCAAKLNHGKVTEVSDRLAKQNAIVVNATDVEEICEGRKCPWPWALKLVPSS